MGVLRDALEKSDYVRCAGTAQAVVRIFDEGELTSP